MDVAELFLELYGRIVPLARAAVEGVDPERLTEPPAPGANTIAWLIWHVARVEDHHIAQVLDEEQIWVTGGWARRFGLDPDPSNTGYGHSAADVVRVQPERPEVLVEYLEAVDERARKFLEGLVAPDLDHVVDRTWDPPVTLGVRLVSVADDSLQHIGQAAYVKGLFAR
jgi:uncharacterized damage-inducible protein DinB